MLRRLADFLAARGMSGPARRCGRLALALNRNSPEALSALIDVARRLDDRPLAIEACRRLVELHPGDVSTRGILATLLLLQGDVDAAAGEAARLRALLPSGEPAPRVVRDSLLDPERARRGEAYVAWLEDVLVETAFWSVVKDDRVYNMEVHGRGLGASPFIEGRVSPDGSAFLMRCPPPAVRIDEPCVHLGGDENYSHWVNRNLLKLALTEERDEFKHLPLLVHEDLRPWQWEYLELLGISPNRLLRVPRNVVVACHRLAVPTLLRNHPRMQLGTDWIRRRLASHMASGTPRGLLFVARRDAARRVMVNEAELADALVRLGFRVIVPSELTAREQIAAFSASRIIIAAHGAALANLVFAPPGAFVVELASAAIMHMSTFRHLTRTLGQRLVTIASDDYDVTRPEPNASHLDYRVDVEEVLAVVRKEAPELFARRAAPDGSSGAAEDAAPAHS
jgi:capsular polysaccharide biosynthesis protein